MDSNDDEKDDDDGTGSKHNKRNTVDPSTADVEVGEAKDEAHIDEEVTGEEDADEEAMSRTDNGKATEDLKEADCVAGNDKDRTVQAGRKSKRRRLEHQKYQDDTWLTEFNDTCGDVILADEDSFALVTSAKEEKGLW